MGILAWGEQRNQGEGGRGRGGVIRTSPNFNMIFPLMSGVMLMMGTPHVWQKYLGCSHPR